MEGFGFNVLASRFSVDMLIHSVAEGVLQAQQLCALDHCWHIARIDAGNGIRCGPGLLLAAVELGRSFGFTFQVSHPYKKMFFSQKVALRPFACALPEGPCLKLGLVSRGQPCYEP